MVDEKSKREIKVANMASLGLRLMAIGKHIYTGMKRQVEWWTRADNKDVSSKRL